jgi:hypothetical protein
MTKKVCIIGDSHIAAFKSVWNTDAERWPSLDLDVFGAQSDNLADFYVRKGKFVTNNKEQRKHLRELTGRARLDLDEYDALILTGMQFSIASVVRMLRTTSHLDQPSCAAVPNDELPSRPLLSNRLIQLYMEERLTQTLCYQVAKSLTKHTHSKGNRTRLILASQPRPASHALELGKAYNGFRVLQRDGDAAYAEQVFERNAEKMCHTLGAAYLPQPEQTREGHLFTSHPFSQGSVRLRSGEDREHKSNDVLHANPTYAGLVLDQICVQMEQFSENIPREKHIEA